MVIALENSPEFKVIGFLDDNIQLHKRIISQKIYSPSNLEQLSKNEDKFSFLALPITRNRRNKIIGKLNL